MQHITLLAVVFTMLFTIPDGRVWAKSERTSDKQAELTRVQKQIEATRKQLQTLEHKETTQSRALGTFTKQKQAIESHLALLSAEKSALQDSISSLRKIDRSLTAAQKAARTAFGRYLRDAYISAAVSPAQHTTAEAIYTRVLAKSVRRYLQGIDKQHDSVSMKRREFDSASAEAAALLNQKATEGKTIESSILQTRATIAEIRTNKELMRRELAEKQRSAEKIRAIVARLIEEERKREEEKVKRLAEQKQAGGKQPKAAEKATKTTAIFRWPVASRKIARKFGQYSNTETNTIMDNPGIDIAAKTGTPVAAAAAGEVSLVHWLPGYNSLIIVDHGNGYRTVYANLAKTLAVKGQTITAGAIIGKTGETADGQFLHFEVWRGTEKINPVRTLK